MRPSDTPLGSPSPALPSGGRMPFLSFLLPLIRLGQPAADPYNGVALGVECAWAQQAPFRGAPE